MERIFGTPGRYIQGPNAIERLGDLLSPGPVLALIDPVAERLVGDRLSEIASRAGSSLSRRMFNGECTVEEIEGHIAAARPLNPTTICAVGGGKAIDTGKALAAALDRPLIVVPTIASNDSPTSTLIVVYDSRHRISEVRRMKRSPDAVLVDTTVIARAPARFLKAGIGDGLSKAFESRQCALAGGSNFFGGRATLTAGALAEACYRVLREDAEAALAAVEAGKPDEALEAVVEAAVLMSGLAFESGGLSLSHALLRGLTAEPPLAGRLHGELVAYALLVQLTLEDRDADFMQDLRTFYGRIGLPQSLHALGVERVTLDLAARIADPTLEAPYIGNFERQLTPESIVEAILAVEAAGEVVAE